MPAPLLQPEGEAAGPTGLSGKGQTGQPGSNEAFSRALRSHPTEELGRSENLEEPVMRVQSRGSGVGKLDGPSKIGAGAVGSSGANLMGEGRGEKAAEGWLCWGNQGGGG